MKSESREEERKGCRQIPHNGSFSKLQVGAERQEKCPGRHREAVRLPGGRREVEGHRGLEGLKEAAGQSRQLRGGGGKETRRVPLEGEEQVS